MICASVKSDLGYLTFDKVDLILASIFEIAQNYKDIHNKKAAGKQSDFYIANSFQWLDQEIQYNILKALLGFLRLPNNNFVFKFKHKCMEHCYNLLKKIYESIFVTPTLSFNGNVML